MKKYLIVLIISLVLLFATIGCGQVFVPGNLIWHPRYSDILGQQIPQNALEHYVQYSDNPDSNFIVLGIAPAPDSSLRLLDFPYLYTGEDTLYFRILAHRTDLNLFAIEASYPTSGHFFPDGRLPIPPNQLIIYDIAIPEN